MGILGWLTGKQVAKAELEVGSAAAAIVFTVYAAPERWRMINATPETWALGNGEMVIGFARFMDCVNVFTVVPARVDFNVQESKLVNAAFQVLREKKILEAVKAEPASATKE